MTMNWSLLECVIQMAGLRWSEKPRTHGGQIVGAEAGQST